MELMHEREVLGDMYESLSGNTRQPFFTRKRIVIGIIIATLLAVLIIVVAVTWKTSAEKINWTFQPLVQWNGDCPTEAECPASFQGIPPPLLLVSLDGFRPDYLERGFTPTLLKISRCGATPEFLYPVYPSKTFPNHFTQVTSGFYFNIFQESGKHFRILVYVDPVFCISMNGQYSSSRGLYPASHGIIDNSMFDPSSGRIFKLSDPFSHDPVWWQKEPIWVSAEKQGKRTATFFWPGSDVEINGTFPTFYRDYNTSTPFESRVDQVLDWLDLPPDRRPQFLTLYLNEPDSAAHAHGIHSEQVNEVLSIVDGVIGRLFSGLQLRNLTNCVNIFIMSDHGMSDINCSRAIDLNKYINVSDNDVFVGTFGRIRPKEDTNATEDAVISDLRCQDDHMRVYRKEQLPIRMHYADNSRIEPVILDVDNGWTLFKTAVTPGHKYCTGGAHGYDNLFPDMRALFTAIGPSMKRNITVKPFLNIELYDLMCELIDILPNPNNGTRGSLHHLLRHPLRPLPPSTDVPEPPVTGKVAEVDTEYYRRVEAAACPCTQPRRQVDVDDGQSDHLHVPFGFPYFKDTSTTDNGTLRLLRNSDYLISYSTAYLTPMWAAFTLLHPLINATSSDEDVCWTGDARVSQTIRCTDYDSPVFKEQHILQRPLYPPGFSNTSKEDEASHVTNSIPKSLYFSEYLEGALQHVLGLWVEQSGQLNIITGPAYAGGHSQMHHEVGPMSVPTHIFLIATWCTEKKDKLQDCDPTMLDVHAFLLPNHPYPDNCEAGDRVIEKNAARVVDIENLTGLTFFAGLPTYEAVRLRSSMPRRPLS